MLNLLYDYIQRSLPEDGRLHTSAGLAKKVSPEGRLLPFYGNTLVFLLPEGVRSALAQLRDGLYAAAPELFAEKLREESFHVTLHDLANSADPAEAGALMPGAAARAREILRRFGPFGPIAMRGTWTFNMVNTSIVLGLEPCCAPGHERLSALYEALEGAVRLGYALTPHVTLAYFRPGEYGPELTGRLRAALGPAPIELELREENLVLQRFTDMNSYFTET